MEAAAASWRGGDAAAAMVELMEKLVAEARAERRIIFQMSFEIVSCHRDSRRPKAMNKSQTTASKTNDK